MSTITWPATRHWSPAMLVEGLQAPKAGFRPWHGGPAQTVSMAADRLTWRVTLPACEASEAAERRGWLMEVISAGHRVLMPHPTLHAPRGSLRGTPTLAASVAAGARSITLSKATGDNLLPSGSFEIDSNGDGLADHWSLFVGGSGDGGRVHALTHYPHVHTHGAYCQEVQINSATTASDTGIESGDIAIGAGEVVTLAADLWCSVTGKLVALVRCYSGGTTLGDYSTATQTAGLTWQRRSITFTTPAGTTHVRVHVRGINAATEYFRADLITLTRGSSAPSAYPAPASLAVGDLLAVGNTLLTVGIGGATANDAGAMTVPLALPAPAALSSGATVLWDRPAGLWQLAEDALGLTLAAGRLQQAVDINLVQV